MSVRCLEGVWKVSGRGLKKVLEGVCLGSERGLEGFWKGCGWGLECVLNVTGRCLKCV